jgi:hypothetical protein
MRERLAAAWLAGSLLALAGGCRSAPAPVAPSRTAADILTEFVEAAEAGDFARAYALLSGPWRARYTPQRLQRDFEQEPLAHERLERARIALTAPPVVRGDSAEFPLGNGKAVRLVKENGEFRLASLE